jgi:protein-S-isoprenylcysteine O-methyltransferase Ste14
VHEPPALPHRFSDMPTVVAVGTGLWLLGAVALLAAHLVSDRPFDVWFTTCVTGVLLGGVGIGIYSWQRAASRRGSRMAQEGLDDEA